MILPVAGGETRHSHIKHPEPLDGSGLTLPDIQHIGDIRATPGFFLTFNSVGGGDPLTDGNGWASTEVFEEISARLGCPGRRISAVQMRFLGDYPKVPRVH